MTYQNILTTIGNTPLIKINGIYAKLETTNPTGSIKDRMAWYIIEQAEKNNEIKKNDLIIEVTSGNTGISLAMLAALRGYKLIAIMPESMSIERQKIMKSFGAKIILTPAKDDVTGAIKKYQKVIKKYPNAFLPKQFENKNNYIAHQKKLGPEIIKQSNGNVDVFVAGVGTGGTLIGVAKALKRMNPNIKIIGVEPAESAVLSGEKAGLHSIQGIGEGFIPKLIRDNFNIIDDIIKIKSNDAKKAKKILAQKYGLLVGISSGANYLAAKKLNEHHKNVFTIFPDRGERYLN